MPEYRQWFAAFGGGALRRAWLHGAHVCAESRQLLTGCCCHSSHFGTFGCAGRTWQAALAAFAKGKKLLDVKVKIRCPNGEVVNSTARLRVDTGANTDVVSLD
jgi:hypothetical protein